MSRASNVALCLRNCRKELRMTLMEFIGSNETMLNVEPIVTPHVTESLIKSLKS
jgi:hypothetical protein